MSHSNSRYDRLFKLADASRIEPQPRETAVAVLTASAGWVKGHLSAYSTYSRLPRSATFMDTFTAKLDRPLAPGDCGSWVYDDSTGNLFGHIVAGSTSSGTVMVMPARAVF
ncbi:hypothetical protein GQ53DRAFT_624949, partial [Thozetella sp. PMI_491]